MTPSKKIAVTGGIGSGKSAFCEILKQKGVPVYSCDQIYAELLGDGEYLSALAQAFPECFTDGVFNKRLLAERIFSDDNAREKLNRLAHPRIMAELMRRMEGHELAFAEVPLLFEGGYDNLFDKIIVVKRGKEARITALSERDGLSREQILSRMNAQCGEEIYEKKNVTVVENDGSKEELTALAEALLNTIDKR